MKFQLLHGERVALAAAVRDRPVISIANHLATIDDPVMWAPRLWECMVPAHGMRWTLAADNICFTNWFAIKFFSLGQGLPTHRGSGVYQECIRFAVKEVLNANGWVHVFPEGRVNQDGPLLRFKWGVGQMMLESTRVPLILPIYLHGFDKMLPVYTHIPKLGTELFIVVGEPLDLTELVLMHRKLGSSDEVFRKAVTDAIQDNYAQLRADAQAEIAGLQAKR